LEVARSQGLATVECIELASALQAVADALDAVADLVLAERVHQLLRGNTVCAGATLDAIARSDAPPPEIDVIQTPRSGTAFTSALYKTCPLPVTTRASHFISVASLKTAGHPSFTQNS